MYLWNHIFTAALSYNSHMYFAMAIESGSVTDSTAQDNIPQKATPTSEPTSFLNAYLGKKKQCPVPSNLLGLVSGNGYTTRLSAERKHGTSFN